MRVADLRQFQVVQMDCDHLDMKLVPSSGLDSEQEAAIKDILARHLNFPHRTDLSYHAAWLRSANGKYEDFMSLLETE
jgi:hypothetical protein